ncbi:MAG: hypothetical protein U1F83_04120 [Verrucomicrobiota bacterium]
MKLLRTMLTLLLVALWPLATSHCHLEQLAGLEFLACADEPAPASTHQDNDCATDSCASIESGFYKTEEAPQVVPSPSLMPSETLTALLTEAVQPSSANQPVFDFAPPEIPKLWQFSCRTALSPRAPSLVS